VEAAQNAGMKAIVLTTTHHPDEFRDLDNVLHFANNFNDEFIQKLV
jgi:beta-phosphoglucomutase-like phosphatase (HAD superfamily)